MSTRTAYEHADSGGLDVRLRERDGNIESLPESGSISFIHINDGVDFEIINSSDDFVSKLADRDNETFGNLWVSELSIHFDLNSKNIHGLLKAILLFPVDAVNHIEFGRQFINVNELVISYKTNISPVRQLTDNINQAFLDSLELLV